MAVTLLSNLTDAPFVEVFIDDIIPEARSLTLTRTSGSQTHKVRGAVDRQTAGTFTVIDYEVPFGMDVTYRAELFDVDGLSLGYTNQASITLDVADTWVHNPLNPSGAVKVQFVDTATRELSRPVPGNMSYPMGRPVGVFLGTERKGLNGVILDVVTDTIEDADRVRALLGDTTPTVPVLCFRIGAHDRIRLPQPLLAAVADIVEHDINYVLGGETIRHEMVGSEAEQPFPGLFVPLLTNADLKAYYASNAAMAADNASNSDLARRYDIAGYASA